MARIKRLEDKTTQSIEAFKPNTKQPIGLAMLYDPFIQRVLFYGGGRAGKTECIIRAIVNFCLEYPGIKVLAVRRELKEAKSSIWPSIKDYLWKYVPRDQWELLTSVNEIWFAGGSVIYIDGLDDNDRVEKIRGREYTIIWVNEATSVAYSSVLVLVDRLAQVVYHPVHKDVRMKQMLIADCNPKHKKHWLYKWAVRYVEPESGKPVPEDYIEEETGEYVNLRFHHLHWTPLDNKENLSAAYLETLKNLPDIRRRRMFEGEWCDNEGLVYDDFDESVHVIDQIAIPDHWIKRLGIDFGYTNPFVCLWFAEDEDGRLYVYDEHYVRRETVNWHADKIKEKCEKNGTDVDIIFDVIADWEAEQRANLEEHGFSVTPAPDCKDISKGLDLVKQRLKVQQDGKPRLFVFRRCENTINEFYAYAYPESKEGRNEDEKPIDKDNHSMSCIRYVVSYLDGESSFAVTPITNVSHEIEGMINGY